MTFKCPQHSSPWNHQGAMGSQPSSGFFLAAQLRGRPSERKRWSMASRASGTGAGWNKTMFHRSGKSWIDGISCIFSDFGVWN